MYEARVSINEAWFWGSKGFFCPSFPALLNIFPAPRFTLKKQITMQAKNFTAKAETTINSHVDSVWQALVNPEKIKKYMFGTTVTTDWKVGSPITWEGEWEGKAYKDKGKILEITPNKRLQYSHYSPLAGEADTPENYHTVTIELKEDTDQTKVTLTQDGNKDEAAQKHSAENWGKMLAELKKQTEN